MAILSSNIQFTGSVGNLSAYRMKGSEKIVLRTKGGASKARIRTAPEFARVREQNAEFGACGKAAGHIRRRLWPVGNLSDYNFTPALCSLARMIQRQDGVGKRGQRRISLAAHASLLPGFNLHKAHPFDSVIRQSLVAAFDPDHRAATISLPQLVHGLNLFIPWRQPMYRIIVHLTMISDVVYDDTLGYKFLTPEADLRSATEYTAWQPVAQSFGSRDIMLHLPESSAEIPGAVLIAAGIQTGTPVSEAVVEPVRYAGCGKILLAGVTGCP